MTLLLYTAAALLVVVGIAHSYLGERHILIRLFKHGDLHKIYRDPGFTSKVIRYAWHLTSIAWWGIAAILLLVANGSADTDSVGAVIAALFLIHSLITLLCSRGRHLAWPLFLAIAILTFYATR